MNIGEIIQRGRRNKNLTQKQLAEIMGVSFSTISHWEKNIRTPSATDLIKLANELQIVSDLFPGYANTKEDRDDKVDKLMDEFVKIKERLDKLEATKQTS